MPEGEDEEAMTLTLSLSLTLPLPLTNRLREEARVLKFSANTARSVAKTARSLHSSMTQKRHGRQQRRPLARLPPW